MIKEFFDYLVYERRFSEQTVESYSVSLKEFKKFFTSLDNELTWETIDEDVIRDWMGSLVDKGMKASSVGTRLKALRSLYRFALSRHLVSRNPTYRIQSPKTAKPLPTFLKESEMNRLLDDYSWGTTFREVRDKTIIMTFYETGVRVSELTGLGDVDVDFVNSQLTVTGKGDKQRVIPFGDELKTALRRYMEQRDREVELSTDALFVSLKGKRMTRMQVAKEVHRHLALVSTQKKLSPHVLRHTFATAMLNHGAGIESVRRLLGHASASTTEIYTHTTFEQLKRVYNEAHPRA